MGEQPPRIYPVVGNSSFMAIISALLFPDILAAFFKSTSLSPKQIVDVEIPTGKPLILELGENLTVMNQ